MAEVNANITPGSGLGVDSWNVGSGAIGSGTEAIRQAVVIGDPVTKANVLTIDASGRLTVLQGTSPWVIQGQQSTLTSGTITTTTSTVTNSSATNYNLATVGIFGTYNSVTFVFEGSPDGTNWFTLQGQRTDTGVAETGGALLTNTIRAWDVFVGGWTQFRVRATAWTSGTANVLMTMQTMPTEPVPTVMQGTSPWVDNISQIGGAALALGQTTMSASVPVAIASNQGNLAVTEAAATSGGCSTYTFLSTAAVQAAAIKASAGQVYGLVFFNNTATICYGRLYNQTASPATTDTANIIFRFLIPANTSGAGFAVPIPTAIQHATGIGIRVTASVADNDATALAANAIVGNVLFK